MLDGKRPPGSRVVVYDCEGYYAGAGMAELLRAEGCEVDTRDAAREVAEASDDGARGPAAAPASARPRHPALGHDRTVGEITATACAASDVYGDAFELACDGVVLTTQRHSDDALFRELVDRPRRASRACTRSATAWRRA